MNPPEWSRTLPAAAWQPLIISGQLFENEFRKGQTKMTNEKKLYVNKHRMVSNRGVLRSDNEGVGFSFDTHDGEPIRLHLTIKDAVWFCKALNDSLYGLLLRVPHTEVGRDTEFRRVGNDFSVPDNNREDGTQ
jgi:hypothetical protein